ncbi:MAG: transposase, partial [Bacteroidota bacterium]
MIREKHHRLPHDVYRGFRIVSITACIRNRIPFFTNEDRFRVFEDMLVKALNKFDCGVEVYLFMPDHVHLLLRGGIRKGRCIVGYEI